MSRIHCLKIFIGIAIVSFVMATCSASQTVTDLLPSPTFQDKQLLESSHAISKQITAIEWLGPLAPVALSPFFGLACLSGIATYGPEWLQQRSAIFGDTSPLKNPFLFWTMLGLTAISSLPRLSKVSKPIALASEKLEAYSVIVILIVMRMFGSSTEETEAISLAVPVYHAAGIISISLDFALAIASAINILVINGVKLFCEFLVWLTPIPFIDAVIEMFNKSLCIGLMGLYCWSPLAASIFNVGLLIVCAYFYFWTQRRIIYYVDLLVGPVLGGWLPWFFGNHVDGERVFLAEQWNGFPAFTSFRLLGSASTGWLLTRRRNWSRLEYRLPASACQTRSGILAETIILSDESSQNIILHRRNGRTEPVSVVTIDNL